MKLYRIIYSGDFKLNGYIEMLIENRQLVEVEPCEHGNYAEHVDDDQINVLAPDRIVVVWCAGAGGMPVMMRTGP